MIEPSVDETVEILKGLKSRFEAHHSVKYTANALTTAAELSARYINDRHLPDKAIDVIDEAGAAQRIAPKAKQKKIGKTEIEEIIAKIARIPPRSVSTDDRSALANLDRDLKAVVFGQDRRSTRSPPPSRWRARAWATRRSRSATSCSAAHRGRQDRGRAPARLLHGHRADPLRHVGVHGAPRGQPPDRRAAGIRRLRAGRLLTEQITKKPYSVLLLDEIEKAHPDIFNILLQVMDHGTLTDNNGRKADFRNVCIVMTTNAGAESLARTQMGFTPSTKLGDEMEAIKRMFTPEFRNRLDAVISFRALDHEIILRVVDKFLMQLEEQLAEKKVEAQFTARAQAAPRAKGFDPLMGARPMARLIQDTIRRALADELLFGRLQHGGKVTIDIGEDEKIKLKFEEEPAAASRPPRIRRAAAAAFAFSGSRVYFSPEGRFHGPIAIAAAVPCRAAAAQDANARNLAAGCAICHGTQGKPAPNARSFRSPACRATTSRRRCARSATASAPRP